MVLVIKTFLTVFITSTLALSSPASASWFVKSHSHKFSKIISQAENLDKKVLKLALKAAHCAMKKGLDKRKILTIIDYSLPSDQKRLWVIDLNKDRVDYHTWVSHGSGSGCKTPKHFSNDFQSHESSLGLMQTNNSYYGEHGYALRMKGLEPGFNDNVYKRAVVIHGASYVSEKVIKSMGRVGRSWGCPAISPTLVKPIVNEIKNDTLVFSYYPDKKWLKESKYLHCEL